MLFTRPKEINLIVVSQDRATADDYAAGAQELSRPCKFTPTCFD